MVLGIEFSSYEKLLLEGKFPKLRVLACTPYNIRLELSELRELYIDNEYDPMRTVSVDIKCPKLEKLSIETGT